MLVEPDDAGAHIGQHRLDKSPPPLRFSTGRSQGLLLRLKVARHSVECAGQVGDLFRVSTQRYAGAEVSTGDTVGGLHQTGDRARDAGGHGQAEPHRADQHEQNDFMTPLEIWSYHRGYDAGVQALKLEVVP